MSQDVYVNVAIRYEKVRNGDNVPTDTISCLVVSIDGKVSVKEHTYKTNYYNPKDIILSLTQEVLDRYPEKNIIFYSDYGSIYEHLRFVEEKTSRFSIIRRKDLTNEQLLIDNNCQRLADKGIKNLKKKRNVHEQKKQEVIISPYSPYPSVNTIPRNGFYVATDASYSDKRYQDISFVSWVSEEGEVFVDTVKTNDNNEAEAYAVRKALKHYAFPGRRLVILTDSRYVTDAAAGNTLPGKEQIELQRLVQTLHSYRENGYTIQVMKVKGHSGHVMNEAAHRAATFARNFHNDYANLYYQKEINKISKSLRSLVKVS